MPSVKVAISPNILNWVLKVTSLEGVDDKLITHFHKWKNNEKQPTFNQIEEFSIKTHIPLGYFFLKTPPSEQIPLLNFRTIDSTDRTTISRELIDTYYHMTAIQDWMRDYLLDSGNDKLSFVGSCKNENSVEKITNSIRNELGLNIDWYSQSKDMENSFTILRKAFENLGILIMKNGVVGLNNHRPLDVNEFRAFTLLDDYAPLVFINNKDSLSGKLFSLLHEIAHIWIGLHNFYNDKHGNSYNIKPLETICNAVAAELLVPNQIFIDKWHINKNIPSNENIAILAKYFKCGQTVLIRKALENNLITTNQYGNFVKEIIAAFQTNKTRRKSGGDFYNTIISRYSKFFILALINNIHEGKTLYKDAYELTGTKRETFNKKY